MSMLYQEYAICESLHCGHESSEPFALRPKRERARWIAKRVLDSQMAAYYEMDETGREIVGMAAWLAMTDRERERTATYYEYHQQAQKMNVGREQWVAAEDYDKLLRQAKRIKRMADGNSE